MYTSLWPGRPPRPEPYGTPAKGGFIPSYISTATQAAPAWGGGAANEEGWRFTGAGAANRMALQCCFKVPADWAIGDMATYIWWVSSAALTSSFYLYSYYHAYWPDWGNGSGVVGGTYSDYVTDVVAANDVIRSPAVALDDGIVALTHWTGRTNPIIQYYIQYYNSGGAEDLEIMGVEFRYTGYI